MTEHAPLTPEQQDQLDQLNYQQALAAWQARETERQAELAKFAPIEGAVDMPALIAALDAVDAGTADLDTRNRIMRLRTILSFDLGALFARLAQLKTAEPEPLAPGEPAPLEPEA